MAATPGRDANLKQVLLVEDRVDVVDLTTKLLDGSCQVHVARDWSAAQPIVSAGGLDLMLVDIGLPGVQGDEIAKLARASDNGDKVAKVVLFSAMDKSDLRALAKEVGADGFVHKDFSNMPRLERKILRFLD